jgi:hypothetical protein
LKLEPSLDAQLPRTREKWRGQVFTNGVHAEVRLTTRYVRTEVGGIATPRPTLDIVKVQVVDRLQRQGRCAAFLRECVEVAAATGRVVFVESVLSEGLHRLLVRAAFLGQSHGWKFDTPFEAGESYVHP